jgi:hypothetical protein
MQIISFNYALASEELTILYHNRGTRLLCVKGLELYELLRREGYAQDYDYKAGRLFMTYEYHKSDPRGIHGVMIEEQRCSLPLEDFMGCELGGASGIKLCRDLVKRYLADQNIGRIKFIKRIRKIFHSLLNNPVI